MGRFVHDDEQSPSTFDHLMDACSCRVRVQILLALALEPHTTGQLAERLGREPSHICHCLSQLRHSGLVAHGRLTIFSPSSLTCSVAVVQHPTGIEVTVTARDGASLTMRLPRASLDLVVPPRFFRAEALGALPLVAAITPAVKLPAKRPV